MTRWREQPGSHKGSVRNGEPGRRCMEKKSMAEKQAGYRRIVHPIPPLYDENSKILILGSFPSVKSREAAFFYGHPRNRFWRTLAGVLSESVPETVEEKKDFLHRNHIAVWDVIGSCEIIGSSDSSIRNVIPNDIAAILEGADIRQIYCNGARSHEYFCRYQEKKYGRKAVKLPSTSPANAAFSLDRLAGQWKQICGPLQAAPAGIGQVLLDWYDYNARILPWRSDPTPYHVWISEIMLQQTRVEAVRGYYDRWMELLPDTKALAAVPDETLMKLWEGLGYYNRARNLKKAAIVIMEKYGGIIPGDLQMLKALPGIGEYTSGAIASIAFGLPFPAVDGNVLRIFSRILALEEDIQKTDVRKKITKEVQRILPKERAGDFNQALMDLGSSVCLPHGRPLCDACPWESVCMARKMGKEQDYPRKKEKKKRRLEQLTVFCIETEGGIALHKRPDQGLLSGLWELPNISGKMDPDQAQDWLIGQLDEHGDTVLQMSSLGEGKHIFTHVEWRMKGYYVKLRHLPETLLQENRWILVSARDLKEQYAVPSAFARYTSAVLPDR